MLACTLAKYACFTSHVMPRLKGGKRDGDQGYACCPWHDDQHASMSIRTGHTVRFVWCCETGCDPADVRLGLLRIGIPEGCVGNYGTTRRPARADQGDAPDKQLAQIAETLSDDGNTPAMLRTRIRNILDGNGKEPSRIQSVFIDTAVRGGVKKSQRYEAWRVYSGG